MRLWGWTENLRYLIFPNGVDTSQEGWKHIEEIEKNVRPLHSLIQIQGTVVQGWKNKHFWCFKSSPSAQPRPHPVHGEPLPSITINAMPLAKWKYSRCLMVLPGQLMSWLTACPPSEVNKELPPPLRTKSIPAKISCRFTHQAAVAWCHPRKSLSQQKNLDDSCLQNCGWLI